MLSTYYVSPSGDDGAAGSSAAPLQTLQVAANKVKAGDTVIVRAGTYTTGFNLSASQDGTAAAPITFKADPGAVITGDNRVTPDAINLEGASWVVIDGFTIRGATRTGVRSVSTSGSSSS